MTKRDRFSVTGWLLLAPLLAAPGVGCKKKTAPTAQPIALAPATPPAPVRHLLRNAAPASMVALAQAWSVERGRLDTSIDVQVSANAADAGTAAVVAGTADLALASRRLKDSEIQALKQRAAGKSPRELVVGFESLCVYVHNANPLDEISTGDLDQLFREKSRWKAWKDAGVKLGAGPKTARIVRIRPALDSGAARYFQEAVLSPNARTAPDALEASSLADTLALVASSPEAIAYGACGATAEVKALRISARGGAPAFAANHETIASGKYPLARPVLAQLSGDAPAHVQNYLDWVLSGSGQRLLKDLGYVPTTL
jgi:phosphate transport system substrate-binding protein